MVGQFHRLCAGDQADIVRQRLARPPRIDYRRVASIGSQRKARPENSRLASVVKVSIKASNTPAANRAALYGSNGGDSALMASAPSAGISGGRSRNGSPARYGTTKSPRFAMSSATPKFVA